MNQTCNVEFVYLQQLLKDSETLKAVLKLLGEAKCPICDGSGALQVPSREREYVTHEMALDAGMPEMEGSLYREEEFELEACQWCAQRDSLIEIRAPVKDERIQCPECYGSSNRYTCNTCNGFGLCLPEIAAE